MKQGTGSKGREVREVGWEVGAEGRVETPTHQEDQRPVQRVEQSAWRSGASTKGQSWRDRCKQGQPGLCPPW